VTAASGLGINVVDGLSVTGPDRWDVLRTTPQTLDIHSVSVKNNNIPYIANQN